MLERGSLERKWVGGILVLHSLSPIGLPCWLKTRLTIWISWLNEYYPVMNCYHLGRFNPSTALLSSMGQTVSQYCPLLAHLQKLVISLNMIFN